jgi:hypothetical protein
VHRTGRSTGPWRRNDISAQTRHENQPVHRTGRSTGPWRRNALSSWARAAVPSTGSQIHAAQCAMPLTRACLRPVSRKCTNELTEDGVQRTEDVLPVERVVTNSVRACGSRSLALSLPLSHFLSRYTGSPKHAQRRGRRRCGGSDRLRPFSHDRAPDGNGYVHVCKCACRYFWHDSGTVNGFTRDKSIQPLVNWCVHQHRARPICARHVFCGAHGLPHASWSTNV